LCSRANKFTSLADPPDDRRQRARASKFLLLCLRANNFLLLCSLRSPTRPTADANGRAPTVSFSRARAPTITSSYVLRSSLALRRYEEFIKIADRNQFFSRACMFPSYLLASATSSAQHSLEFRHKIGAIVHMSSHMMETKFDQIEKTLPMQSRLMFSGARREVTETIDFFSAGGCIDGLAPMAAYRRLLLLCLQIRTVNQENGIGMSKDSGALLPSNCLSEVEAVTTIVRDFDPCPMTMKLETFKKSFSVKKMVEFWRKKVSLSHGVPLGIIRVMRCGYLSGRGEIRSRRVLKPIDWALSCIGQVVTFKVAHDGMLKRSGKELSSMNQAVHAYFLRQYGIVSVAERTLHDLFVSTRTGMGHIARLKTFGALTGVRQVGGSQVRPASEASLCDLAGRRGGPGGFPPTAPSLARISS
jgi:hypothetical protein